MLTITAGQVLQCGLCSGPVVHSEILPDEKGTTCAAYLTRAAAYSADHGIPRIERVMNDNAWAYRWSLREVTAALGARQKFVRPPWPWQSGKVERVTRTLATEWAYRQVFVSYAERAAALAPSGPLHSQGRTFDLRL